MSLTAWRSLSDEDRKIFRDAARKSNRYMRAQWSALEDRSRREAEAAGVVIVKDFDRKPFEKAMTGVYASAVRDPATARLIERIRQTR